MKVVNIRVTQIGSLRKSEAPGNNYFKIDVGSNSAIMSYTFVNTGAGLHQSMFG